MANVGAVRAVSGLIAAVLVVCVCYLALTARHRIALQSGALIAVVAVLEPSPRRRDQLPPPRALVRREENDVATVAESAAPDPANITAPVWIRRPRNPEGYYPSPAFVAGVEGEVELECLVDTRGGLICTVTSETPAGWGFGDAALALSRECLMQPPQHNGAPAPGRYRMRIPFTQPR